MISPEFVQTMARYNRWQNRQAVKAAASLGRMARELDRGAFFVSISGTFSHLMWGDTMWMSRFDGWEPPPVTIGESLHWIEDWDEFTARRDAADAAILDWSGRVEPATLGGMLSWYSGMLGSQVERPMSLCVMHFFNHQAHHRGQLHAMLTSAGAKTGSTDLFLMPMEA